MFYLRKNRRCAVRREVDVDVVSREEGEEEFVEAGLQVVGAHSRTADCHGRKVDLFETNKKDLNQSNTTNNFEVNFLSNILF